MNFGGGTSNGENGNVKFPIAWVPHLLYGLAIIFGGGSLVNEQLNHGKRLNDAEGTIREREHRISTLERDVEVLKTRLDEDERLLHSHIDHDVSLIAGGRK